MIILSHLFITLLLAKAFSLSGTNFLLALIFGVFIDADHIFFFLKKFLKNHKLKNSKKTPPQNLQKNEEAVLSTLQALYDKEQELQEEKDRLLDIEETLKKRIINEIEIKKSTIIDLENEIPELKQRIEKLAQILEIPVEKKPEN